MHVYIPIACVYTYIVVIENWGQSVSTSKCLSFQNLYFNNPLLFPTTTRVGGSILLIFFPLQAVFTFSEWYYKLLMEWEGWIPYGVSLFFFKKTVLGSFYFLFFFFIQHWIFKAGAFILIWQPLMSLKTYGITTNLFSFQSWFSRWPFHTLISRCH